MYEPGSHSRDNGNPTSSKKLPEKVKSLVERFIAVAAVTTKAKARHNIFYLLYYKLKCLHEVSIYNIFGFDNVVWVINDNYTELNYVVITLDILLVFLADQLLL